MGGVTERRLGGIHGFRAGDRVELVRSSYPMHHALPDGTRGTVHRAAIGTFLGAFLDVQWDNGLRFFVQPGRDELRRIEDDEGGDEQ